MTREFEEKMQKLHEEYEKMPPEERKAIKQYLKKNNMLLFRKFEHIRHDLLRLEAKRAQCSLDGDIKELTEQEKRILSKKQECLSLIEKAKMMKDKR